MGSCFIIWDEEIERNQKCKEIEFNQYCENVEQKPFRFTDGV